MNKYLKYLSYVLRHKWFVFVECYKHGLIWQGIIHDLSKFSPAEFIPYSNFFFGEKNPETKHAFKLAWLHHQNVNPHHWQHWVQVKDSGNIALDIPLKYRIEMVCDWKGAGKAQGHTWPNEAKEWYLNNRDSMILADNTKAWVDDHFGVTNDD